MTWEVENNNNNDYFFCTALNHSQRLLQSERTNQAPEANKMQRVKTVCPLHFVLCTLHHIIQGESDYTHIKHSELVFVGTYYAMCNLFQACFAGWAL